MHHLRHICIKNYSFIWNSNLTRQSVFDLATQQERPFVTHVKYKSAHCVYCTRLLLFLSEWTNKILWKQSYQESHGDVEVTNPTQQYFIRGLGDGSVGKNTCSANVRIWIWIPGFVEKVVHAFKYLSFQHWGAEMEESLELTHGTAGWPILVGFWLLITRPLSLGNTVAAVGECIWCPALASTQADTCS